MWHLMYKLNRQHIHLLQLHWEHKREIIFQVLEGNLNHSGNWVAHGEGKLLGLVNDVGRLLYMRKS